MEGERSIDASIASLKEAHRAKSDRELALALGLKPNAVANWRLRKAVPSKYVRDDNVSSDGGFPDGSYRISLSRMRGAYAFAVLEELSKRLRDEVQFLASNEDNLMWRAYRLSDAHAFLSRELAREETTADLHEGYLRLRDVVQREDMLSWLEGLR